MQYNNS